MTYENLAHFAQTGGLVIFVIAFVGVLAYALWPGNAERFERAAEIPLAESDVPGSGKQTRP